MRGFLIFLWFVLALPLAAFAQTDERDALTAFLEDNLSSADRKVTVTGFSGAFSSQAQIEQLTIADSEGTWLTLTGVVLNWSRAALLRGVISIEELTAQEVIVARAPISPSAPPTPEASGFALPELPVSVSVKKLEAARIVLGETLLGQEVEGTFSAAIELSGGDGRIDLQITRGGDGPDGRVNLIAGYSNATGQTEIDLDAAEAAGGIAVTLLKVPGSPDSALKIKGSGPLNDFSAQVSLETDGQKRLAGDVTLQGTEGDALKFSADLAGDPAPLFLPEYAEFFGSDVRFRADGQRSKLGQIDLNALSVATRALTLDGAVQIAPDGLPERISLTGRLGLSGGASVLLPLSGDIDTRVQSADLRLNFDASKGDGWSGAVVVAGLDRSDIALTRVALTGEGRIDRRTGQADGPVIDAALTFETIGLTPSDAALAEALGPDLTGTTALTWQPGGEGFRISDLALNGAGYGVELSGTIGDLAGGFPLSGNISARYDGLGRLSALAGRPLAGGASISATGAGTLLGGDFDIDATIGGQDITIGQAEVDSLLQGRSTIALSAQRDSAGTVLRSLDLNAGQLRVTGAGTLATSGSNLTARLQFGDLSVLGPAYRGALNADAAFSGTPVSGRLTLDGLGTDLMIGQQQADAVLAGQSRLTLDVALNDGRFDIQTLTLRNPQITAKASGYVAESGSDLLAGFDFADIAVLGTGYKGGLNAELHATGTMAEGQLDLTGQGRGLAIGQADADKLLSGTSQVTARVNVKDTRFEIESAEITNPQVAVSLSGSVTDALRQITLNGNVVNLALLVPEFPGALQLSGSAKEDADGFALDLTGQGPGGVDAKVFGRISTDLKQADLTIKGVAQAALANPFLGSRSVSGQTQFDLRLSGPLTLGSLSGQVGLSDGRLSDPALPLGLQNIAATARLGDSAVQLDLSADATTGGRISTSGSIGLSAPNEGNLTIGLTNLQLQNPDLFKTSVSGSVSVAGPLTGGALISGDILVGDTELRVPSTGLGGSGAIPDLRHVNEPADVRRTRANAGLLATEAASGNGSTRPFRLDVRVNAPQRIFLRGRGLDAELGGRLTIRGTTDAIIPSGAIDLIRGRLDILGKRLDLDQAKLELQGRFIPYLTVLASNQGDSVTSFVEISGPADEPVVRFYSSPDLPQEEVLAQLLFGRDITKISALQAIQLASAVATLAGKGGDGIVGNLRKSFGLDDLDVSTDAEGNSAVKAGKYISRNVYSEVEVDQNGQSKINLNLDITKSTKLRGSVGSDGQTGIGVFVERDY